MVLVAGSTGMVGGEICRILARKGQKVRALVRPSADQVSVQALVEAGVEIAEGDVREPRSLERACKGVRNVISTVSSMPTRYRAGDNDLSSVDDRGTKNLVDAARAARAESFVLVSFPGDVSFPLHDAKREAERYLQASKLTWTILYPTFFTEVWLSALVGFDFGKASVRLYGTGENAVSFVSFRDVAAVAAAGPDLEKNSVVPIFGPQALRPNRVVKMFEEAAGAAFAVERIPEAALAAQFQQATDPMQKSFAALMLGIAGGDGTGSAPSQPWHGMKMRTVGQYIRDMVPQGVPR